MKKIIPSIFCLIGVLALSNFLASGAIAAPKTKLVNFTPEEITKHQENIDLIISKSTQCLKRIYKTHVEFYEKWGVSKYYGERKPQHQTRAGLLGELKRFGAPSHLISELEPTACISLAIKCLREGFVAAGTGATFEKIHRFLKIDRKVYGSDLQIMLQQLGWKLMYFNPDPAQNKAWDLEDRRINPVAAGKKWNPVWGAHESNYKTAVRQGTYYNGTMKIDDAKTLVGFKEAVPMSFKKIPFFLGIAHSGYHVFPGYFGEVIEAHSTRNLNAADNLEISQFNPLAPNGGPRWTKTERYRSGVIAVPPVQRR